MGSIWQLALLKQAVAGDCADPATHLREAEGLVVEGRFDEARARLDALEASWACGPPADPALLAAAFRAEGALAHLTQDPEAAADAFVAAGRLDADGWTSAFGEPLRKVYQAQLGRRSAMGEIVLRPPLEAWVAWLDGTQVKTPVQAPAGLHLVQVGPPSGPAAFGRVVFLTPGDALVLEHGLVEAAVAPPVAARDPAPPPAEGGSTPSGPAGADKRPAVWAWTGGLLLAAGAGTAGAALAQDGAMRRATEVDELNAAFARQKALGVSSYVLLGLGATSLTFHLVW